MTMVRRVCSLFRREKIMVTNERLKTLPWVNYCPKKPNYDFDDEEYDDDDDNKYDDDDAEYDDNDDEGKVF